MTEKIDKYEIRARIIPGLLLCLPVLITVGAVGLDYFHWLTSILGSAFITIVLSYGLSMLLRSGGVALQKKMYKKWGGPPSTRFLRWSDVNLSDQKKTIIQSKIKKDFKIQLLSKDEESTRPKDADRVINDAFDSIREKLRAKKKVSKLWETHNIEYGFYRNFLGSWHWGFILSVIGIAILLLIYLFGETKDIRLLLAVGINVLYGVILSVYAFTQGEQNLKHTAEQYVRSAMEAYLSLK
jgi:hypothetical protein